MLNNMIKYMGEIQVDIEDQYDLKIVDFIERNSL